MVKYPAALSDFGLEGASLYTKLSEDYSLWLIPSPKDFKPTYLDIKYAKSQYWDVVQDDSIIEIFLKKDMDIEKTQRLTFVKYANNYEFYGVFQVETQKKCERTFYRVADKFDILNIKN